MQRMNCKKISLPNKLDDTDDIDDEIEFNNWKLRELKRIENYELEIKAYLDEQRDIIRRRNMTEDERLEEDNKLKLGIFKNKDKAKWKFLQKYYHKGVFYMDESSIKNKNEEDVRLKEYNMPTLEDNFDKEKLPKILQVKNFGKRGRTKYTHLTDQDTTNFNNILKPDETIKSKYINKMSGIGNVDIGRSNKKTKL
jgi:microfibrillar-associated protein 1